MKRKNTARNALFTSIISLLLCVSMLVGTTFAWFTDSVISGNNVIAAGNLDVELYNSIGIDAGKKVSESTPLFEEVELWEPGVVAYENLTVANVGTLALKYQLTMNITGENTVAGTNYKLSDVLKIAVVEGGVKGTTREAVLQEVAESGASWETLKTKALSGDLEAETSAEPVGLVIYWQPTANDNNWNLNNGKTTSNGAPTLQITLGINLFATQLQHENDSFDNTYDKDAALEIPEVKVETPTADAFIAALEAGETAVLTSNLTLDGDAVIPAGATSAIDLNGFTLNAGDAGIFVKGNVIVTDSVGNGSMEVTQPGTGLLLENGSALEVQSGVINVTGDASTNGIMVYNFGADTTINIAGGKINAVGETNAIGLYGGTTEMVVADGALNGTIDVGSSGTLNLTYYGDTQPNVTNDDGTAVTLNIRKGTAYEGITQNPDNAKQYYIESKAGLMNLNALLAGLDLGEGKGVTVDLTTDIDLTGEDWTPINSMWVTFNGNGHTISNINAGLSTDGRRSGFWAYAGAVTINDLTLENVTVSGSQAGIFVGGAEGTKINNCFLKGDNTVNFVPGVETWNGIGAISGVLTDSNINVEIVEGATVNLNTNGMTTDPNCTYVDDLTGYIQKNNGTVTNNGTIVKGVAVATSAELLNAINNAAFGSKTVVEMADGTYADDINLTLAAIGSQKGDLVFKAAADANPVISGTVTLGYRNQGTGAAMWNGNVTFEGVTFNHANDATHSIDVQDVKSLTLKNCTIIGDGEYGITSARGNGTGTSSITGCTFENAGMQLLGNFATGLVIDYCTLNNSRINVQAGNGVTVQNCTFNDTLTDANVNDSFYLVRSNSTPITVTNCDIYVDSTVTGVAENQAKWGIFWNRGTTNWTVSDVNVNLTATATNQTELLVTKCTSTGVINTTNLNVKGVVTVSTNEALTSEIKEGNDVVLTAGNYQMPDGSDLILRDKELTISGTKDTVIDVSNVDARDQFVTGATLVFDGVTLNFGTVNYMGFANTESLTFKNCQINGLQFLFGENVTFQNCDLNSNGAEHCVWTYGAQNVSFIECDFTYGDRGINCYSDNDVPGGKQTVNFTDCTFTTTNTASKGAVEINSYFFSVGIEVNLEGCTAPAYGEMAYVSEWDSNNGAKTTINIK